MFQHSVPASTFESASFSANFFRENRCFRWDQSLCYKPDSPYYEVGTRCAGAVRGSCGAGGLGPSAKRSSSVVLVRPQGLCNTESHGMMVDRIPIPGQGHPPCFSRANRALRGATARTC